MMSKHTRIARERDGVRHVVYNNNTYIYMLMRVDGSYVFGMSVW